MIVTTTSALETKKLGEKLSKKFIRGTVVCLRGELGAGKTTFIQGVAKGLRIKKRINSPTFIIVRRYDNFWHIDLYRLSSYKEAQTIGIEEIINDKTSVILIEWPEKIEDILPKKRWEIKIGTVSENERRIDYETLS